MTTILTVVNWKGGVGKTTTAAHLAVGLAAKGKRVLAVDADPQGHLAPVLGVYTGSASFATLLSKYAKHLPVVNVRDNLDLIPGGYHTHRREAILQAGNEIDTLRLERYFSQPRFRNWHYIIIDTSPSVSLVQEMAIMAADALIVPVAVDNLALRGFNEMFAHLTSLQNEYGPENAPGIISVVPTFYDDVTTESRRNLHLLVDAIGRGRRLLAGPIHRATVLREASAAGKTVFEYAPKSRATEEYAALMWHIIEQLEG